jgi:hypothetical protein
VKAGKKRKKIFYVMRPQEFLWRIPPDSGVSANPPIHRKYVPQFRLLFRQMSQLARQSGLMIQKTK